MLQPHPTWNIYDSTKVSEYKSCPRSYFFKYILGWRPERPSNHLVFGSVIHTALAYCYENGGFTNENIESAFDLAYAEYREVFSSETDNLFKGKHPGVIIPALIEYSERYKHDDFDVIHTEVAGGVLIDPEITLKFKIDLIGRSRSGLYFAMEHKTGSRLDASFSDKYSLSTQIGMYNHVLNMMYFKENEGVVVNGLIFRSKDRDFIRIPMRKTDDQMAVWQWDTQNWIKRIKEDTSNIMAQDTSDTILTIFPMNSENCVKWGTCPFFDYCLAWPNPLRRYMEDGGKPPQGFIQEWWDPSEREKTAKKVVNL